MVNSVYVFIMLCLTTVAMEKLWAMDGMSSDGEINKSKYFFYYSVHNFLDSLFYLTTQTFPMLAVVSRFKPVIFFVCVCSLPSAYTS